MADRLESSATAVAERPRAGLLALLVMIAVVVLGTAEVRAAPPEEVEKTEQVEETQKVEPPPQAVDALSIPSSAYDPDRMSLIWRQASVAWPVRPLAPGGEPTRLAAGLGQREELLAGIEAAPSVRGPVEIDGERAVAVWIAALETVRVRQVGEPVPLRLIRGVDGNAAVVERGREVAPGPGGERRFELFQPPSLGAVWSIEADAPTRVIIERVEERPVRYAAVEVEQALLDWIHANEPIDAMPDLLVPADDLARRLHLHAALADELRRVGGEDPKLGKGIEAWRMLAAINQIDRERPPARPYYVRDRPRKRPLAIAGSESLRLATEDSREYRGLDERQRWTITRKGPGQLRVSARAWAPEGGALQPAELRIYANGRYVQRLALSDRQAKHSVDPDTAIPELEPLETEAGDAVGEFAETIVVLAPSKVDYEFELIGGPALLSIDGARRIEASVLSLKGRTPRKRAKAVAKAVAKTDSDAGAWLELLLAREALTPLPMTVDDPRIEALGERSPILALELLALLASDERVDGRALEQLVARARTWLAKLALDPSIDPAVRGELRTRWLELVVIRGDGGDLDAVIERVPGGADPIVELPVEGLRLLAEQFEATQAIIRSPVLAVLELARARAPADEGLREQTLRVWTALSRWSRQRPVSDQAFEFGLPFRPIGEWLVPRKTMPLDPVQILNTWLRLEVGVSTRVVAKLGPGAVRRSLDDEDEGEGSKEAQEGTRMRLVDIHVASPLEDPDPILLEVDGHRWWSPQLRGVVRHRVAMTEGTHELSIHGPAETVAWAELPPAEDVEVEPELLGRRERMWSLADADWFLPGPTIPGIVRLELRWPLNQEPQPIRIVMHQHGEFEPGDEPPAKAMYFDPRTARVADMSAEDAALAVDPVEIDREATPMAGSPWASPRHEINLPIRAETKHLSFEVEGGLVIPAALSLRRGLRPGDMFEGMSEARVKPEDDLDPRVAAVFEGLTSLSGEALLDEIAGLSRLLLYTPSDLESRARRAAVLLMLGETGHARADLVRLSAWAESADAPRDQLELARGLLIELEDRFDRLIEPREILVTKPGFDAEPVLIEPALAAVVGPDRVVVEPWLETWSELRQLSNDDALVELELALAKLAKGGPDAPGDLERALFVGEVSRAEILARDSLRARDASRAWLELYAALEGEPGRQRDPLAVGLAAVPVLLAHLDNPDSDGRDAGVAYGLARELEPAFGHTSVRRLAFIAALRSAWETVDHSTDNAGFERLELPVSELQRSPSARIREALVVTPWTASEAEELRPGRKGVLAWDAEPGAIQSEFWCRVARPDLGPERVALADDPDELGRAQLRLRLRAGDDIIEERDVAVADAERLVVELPIERRKRHRLEVVLGADPVWLCSWRTRTLDADALAAEAEAEASEAGVEATTKAGERGEALDTRRRARWWTADSDRGVEFVILGPASLDLEVRGVTRPLDEQPQALRVSLQPLRVDAQGRVRSGEVEESALTLDAEPDKSVITEARRHFRVNQSNVHTVLLPEAVAYRVRLRSDVGRSVLRARVRRDRGEVPPPAQVSLRELDPRSQIFAEDFEWRTSGLGQIVIARDEVEPLRNRIGTLDARVRLGLDDIADVDSFAPKFGSFVRVGWRREIIENAIYLSIAAQTRSRVQSPTVGGGILGFGARVQPLGLRLGADLDVLGGAWAGRAAGSMRLYAFIDRPTWLGRWLQLRPGFTAGIRWQSLSRADVAAGPGNSEPHPRVFLPYIEDHPLFLRPELELRGYPFQDMVLRTMVSLVPNSDLRSTDHFNWDLGLYGIGRRPRPWVPTWQLSYQLSTRFADADRDLTQLRHRLVTGLGVAVWARDLARVGVGVDNQLYITPVLGKGAFSNVIELWIRLDAVFGRRLRDYGPGEIWLTEPWAPLGWADDPRQARSTGLRRRTVP